MSDTFIHDPVLRQSVKDFMLLRHGDIAVDATMGLGGHTIDMLEAVLPSGHIYGFDQDSEHVGVAKGRIEERFGKDVKKSFSPIHSNFAFLHDELSSRGVSGVNAILFDLGIALSHLTRAERGFSFQEDGPLDMRMDQTYGPRTAADILAGASESELADIFFQYGEEPHGRRIARAIVADRKQTPFVSTRQLAGLMERIIRRPPGKRTSRVHPATRVFQALRIAVNSELDVLQKALPQAFDLLVPGGRLVVISYHSLEDRIVKHFFRDLARECVCPQEVLRCECSGEPRVKLLTKHPVEPDDAEIASNPRSRSAKLRAIQKI